MENKITNYLAGKNWIWEILIEIKIEKRSKFIINRTLISKRLRQSWKKKNFGRRWIKKTKMLRTWKALFIYFRLLIKF